MSLFSKEQREKIKASRRERKLKRTLENKTFRDQLNSIRVDTFTKALVALIVIVAIIDLQLSYVLAFMDKIQIAEELSKQVCTTILGTALIYMIRAYFDSKAEYGNQNTRDSVKDITIEKAKDVISNTNIPFVNQINNDSKNNEPINTIDPVYNNDNNSYG